MTEARNEITAKIRDQLHNCAGWDGDQISQDRKRALDYYFQRPRGDETAGRSNVVSGDISAMVESNLAQMLESFSGDAIVEFSANGPEDDDQAHLESFAVTAAVMKDNNGYQELATAIKDALLLRNGFIKVWVDEDNVAATVDLEQADGATIAALEENAGVTVEVLRYDEAAGTARIRTTKQIKRFRAEAIDPSNILYLKQWHKGDLQEIPFIAERHIEAREKLLRRGFEKKTVDALQAYAHDTKIDSLARDVREVGDTRNAVDKSQELVQWFECYALVDGGNGISERRRISVAGSSSFTLLEDEPVSLVPYAQGSAFINSHRVTGISIYDKLRQTQDINTGLSRALLDNVNTVIKNRTAYLDGKVNTDDLADGRPNGNIRVKANVGNVNNAITAFNTPDISRGILENLNYQRQVRTELGGASLELATGQMQMAGGRIGSQGVDRAFSVMEQLSAHMTKNLATSLIRNLFLLAHATLREYFDEPFNVKVNGRWLSPVPSQWIQRTRLDVKIGMSPGERSRKVATLQQVVDAQIALAREGMDNVLVNIDGFYRALTDWGRNAELPNPEQYFIDPQTEASQQALKAKEQSEAKAAEANRALMSHAVGLEQLRTAFEKYKVDQKTAFDYWAETLRAEIEEAKIVGAATADLIKQTKFGSDDVSKSNGQESNANANNGRD